MKMTNMNRPDWQRLNGMIDEGRIGTIIAKDTSRKIKAVFNAKGNSGKPLTTNPPYGYLKDPEDKNHWIIDEEVAPVVPDIFKMCVAGKGPSQISKELMRRGIPTPAEHYQALGISTPAKLPDQPGFWQQRTIADMLLFSKSFGFKTNVFPSK